MMQELNEELKDPNHVLRKRVENLPLIPSITVKYAKVSQLKITTKDGKDDVGEGGKNIAEIYYELITIWDGVIHKDGKTILGITMDVATKQVTVIYNYLPVYQSIHVRCP